jgi:putative endonuclease
MAAERGDDDDGPTAPAAGRRAFRARSAEEAGPIDRQAIGARAEGLVAAHLAQQGMEILGLNVRVGRLELDIVARDGPVVVVVEVRARGPGSWVRPLDSVDRGKRARVRRAGERLWRDRFARDASVQRMRFDVAAVELGENGEARIEIVRAAF